MPLKHLLSLALLFLVTACATHNSVSDSAALKSQPGVKSDGAPLVRYTEQRQVCLDRNPNRNAYFGDLHIHTGFSYDARPFGTEITPADAYHFAKGGPIATPPYNENGEPTGVLTLKRPLDFAAVTDHSEFFGELALCSDPSSSVYDTRTCWLLRQGEGRGLVPFFPMVISQKPERLEEICGPGGTACDEASISLWQATQDMAEAAYDRSSACEFTSFVAYEHTGTPNSNNYHRNVIFRNEQVPERAISYIETPKDHELWAELNAQCVDGIAGCEVLAIPHNSNISSGEMFPSYAGAFESQADARARAQLRNIMEPVMEVFQHKGSSECFNGFPDILGEPDELCNMEQVRSVGERLDPRGDVKVVEFCEEGEVGQRGFISLGCVSKNEFYRSVLLTGLQDEAVIGLNSYKFGVIASTDTHIGLAGYTDEQTWIGHLVEETELQKRLMDFHTSPRSLTANPGGLAGVWAVENGRDAIFESLQRREVFGTTGTRIKPRLFGGWSFAADSCGQDNRAAYGYANGTPMGGDLDARPGNAKPTFMVSAEGDPESAHLQKLQVIKGWVDGQGQSHYKVFDVAGAENEAGDVDLQTGEWSGTGSPSLCTVFEDETFNPSEPSYYYLRAVEVPTLRWSWAQCVALPESERPQECENDAPKTTQELAWTSPIWYLPAK
ncbi:MAG: DUF3604 domain-containing protein [Rhodospirillaceae bacterium]